MNKLNFNSLYHHNLVLGIYIDGSTWLENFEVLFIFCQPQGDDAANNQRCTGLS